MIFLVTQLNDQVRKVKDVVLQSLQPQRALTTSQHTQTLKALVAMMDGLKQDVSWKMFNN